MAALLLSFAGAAAGSALFGPAGALAGRIVGALAGDVIDRSLLLPDRQAQGPRLADLDVMASTEGAPVPRVYGRVRLSGQVIWATRLEEAIAKRSESAGGKGLGGPKVTTTTYSYFANFAVGLCEGPIGRVGRVWADGKPLDLSTVNHRIYTGSQTQEADPLIVAKEEGGAPAYRGLAYVVFERLPLADFGNRIPQLSFELIRPVGELERMVRAVTLIPGTTEFGYDPSTVVRINGPGCSANENRHLPTHEADVAAALDELQAVCPHLESVAVVVAWFGDDLRAGQCVLKPGVESATKSTHGRTWSVAGINRAAAHVVSTVDGRPAFGGTPSDQSVVGLIAELKVRGLKVTLYPFVMMDIPTGNSRTDPWTGASTQPAYPWRGRITCDPAPGQPGSVDGTEAAAGQIASFFDPSSEAWSYRRMILHYAGLAVEAGGVDAFLIGSELKSLTRVRSASGVYPAVDALIALAEDVRAVVGSETLITYGADWTEYGVHVVNAGATEIRFPLDALWASSAIDAVGIDYYAPLSDWRDDANHLDRALATSIHDPAYLAGNLRAGEAYDWYYADTISRTAQTRTPITDGLGKPWIHRAKDLWNWWSNPHFERVGGVELPSPTAWTPQSKPIWLTELGCPAVDKGANQPSVFPDAKSSENAKPYFSNGARDDAIQRRYLQAVLSTFDPQFGATEASNPISSAYGGRMVDASAICLWTWDARPYPAFPLAEDIWSDGVNWHTGHWLTGRLGTAPMGELIAAILDDAEIADADSSTLTETVDGYVLDRPMSPRAAIEPLALAYGFDAAEQSGVIAFRPRGGKTVAELDEDDLVLPEQDGPARLVRAQETELPREVSLGFTDTGTDYRRAAVTSRRLVGASARTAHADLAVVTNDAAALRRADIWLQDLWAGRESAEFVLPPSRLALAPGDVVGLTLDGRRRLFELRECVDTSERHVRARGIDPDVFDSPVSVAQARPPTPPCSIAPVHAVLLDLPTLTSADPPVLTRLAVFADPWPGAVAVWRSADGLAFDRATLALAPAIVGETLDALPRGPTGRFDRANTFRVNLYGGALSSVSEAALLDGANVAALRRGDGAWEVIQFASAELVGEGTYELKGLLRGQAGSEWAMGDPLAAGAAFVVLDEHAIAIASGLDTLERPAFLRLVAAGRDHGDAAAVALTMTPSATALRPLSPVHLRAARTGAGVQISFVRRTRRDGDSWAAVDVPLGEEQEAYFVDILSGATLVRRIESTQPNILYASADELADFGAPQTSIAVSIAQLSAIVGPGYPASAILPIA